VFTYFSVIACQKQSLTVNCDCFSISSARASDVEYLLTTGTTVVDNFTSYAVVIASLKTPAGINVKASM